jgi:hypothetical protein
MSARLARADVHDSAGGNQAIKMFDSGRASGAKTDLAPWQLPPGDCPRILLSEMLAKAAGIAAKSSAITLT